MRKVLYISGTRADYGLMKETLFQIKKHPQLNLEIVVTGMHLMPEFGKTVDEIKKDRFKIHQIKALYEGDKKESMTLFIGKFIELLTKKIKKIKPDIILLLGDRGEMLAGAIVGAYLTIPVAHIHGGEITSTVDEFARHTITKLAHIHFPASTKSAERIKKMGEDAGRIFVAGAPGIESIVKEKLLSRKKISDKYGLDYNKPLVLLIQHPLTNEAEKAGNQIKEILEAVKEIKEQTVVIYPNADAGGRKMIKVIEQYRKYDFIKIYKSLPRKDYLSLMKRASVLAGNSSSGIIESCYFKLPVVNIGTRQRKRERGGNVVDVNCQKIKIKKTILKTIYDQKFRARIKKSKNPYTKMKTGEKIAAVLAKIKIDKTLLEKQINY